MSEVNIPTVEPSAPIPEGVNLGVSPDEDRKIDGKMNQEGMSAFEAEYRVIGLERACARRGMSLEEGKALLKLPKEEEFSAADYKTAYPEGPVYRPHPIPVGNKQRMIGDEPVPPHNPSKADHAYGPRTKDPS
jgi:hypothetical protein